MTLRDAIEYVNEIYENAFDTDMKILWINQVEAEIQVEVLLTAVDGITQYTENSMEAELIAPAPFDKIYPEYLIWRIMLAQGEAEQANNQHEIYNAAYLAYVRYVADTIAPGSGKADRLRYYLTAYQIAVKYGYRGAEEEWVESLKGSKGDAGAGLRIVGQVSEEEQLPTLSNSDYDIGKGYLVGSGTTALLYIWDGQKWFYKTQLSGKGEKGEPGAKGETGKDGEDGVGIQSISFKSSTTSGNVYTVTLTNGKTYDFIAPPGPAGPIGPTGETGPGVDVEYDAASGTVSIINGESGGGGGTGADGVGIHSIAFKAAADEGNIYTITLTDGRTYDIVAPKGSAGEPGAAGADGKDGVDGVSPVVSVTEITGGHRVTITDVNGAKTFDVMDGEDGAAGAGTDRLEVTFTYTSYNEVTCSHAASEIREAATAGKDVVAFVKGYSGINEIVPLRLAATIDAFSLYFYTFNGEGTMFYYAQLFQSKAYVKNAAVLNQNKITQDHTVSSSNLVPSSYALNQVYQIANAAIPATEKAAANGVATLDANRLVPTDQICTMGDFDLVEPDGWTLTKVYAKYVKIGRLVHFRCHYAVTPPENTSGSMTFETNGLPRIDHGTGALEFWHYEAHSVRQDYRTDTKHGITVASDPLFSIQFDQETIGVGAQGTYIAES